MFNLIINKMKSDSKEARNVFNCEAFHLEHINSVAEARQFIKYQVLELGMMYYGKELGVAFGKLIGKENITLSEEEIEICDRLNEEFIDVCHRNDLNPILFRMRYIDKIEKPRCGPFEPFAGNFVDEFHFVSMQQVEKFAEFLEKGLQIQYDPEEDFNNYIDIYTGEKQFSKEQAEIGNRFMKECLEVCKANGKEFPVRKMGAN